MAIISVIGLGFVGLTTALGMAELGHRVYGYDENQEKLKALRGGKIHFAEPCLESKLRQHKDQFFFLDCQMDEMISNSDCVFICVGSPCQEDGQVDLTQVTDALNHCLNYNPHDGRHRTYVIKSTVPPGTCKNVVKPMIRGRGFKDEEIGVASNPEFLREGKCWNDFMNPGRVVIGSDDMMSINLLRQIYLPLKAPIHCMSSNGAEFSKYLSNVMLATLISFSNELAYAAKCFGDIDVIETFETLHDDERLKGSGIASYLYPGCGYGGYCLPKDVQAFMSALMSTGYRSNLLDSVIAINSEVKQRFCDEISEIADPSMVIGVLGLAFKAETDDVRDTPAYHVIKGLQERGYASIVAYDPLAEESFKKSYPELKVEYFNTAEKLIDRSDIVVITTAWEQFKELDYKNKKVIDGRYMMKEGKKNGNEI